MSAQKRARMEPIVTAPLPVWRLAVTKGFSWWRPLRGGGIILSKNDGSEFRLSKERVERLLAA